MYFICYLTEPLDVEKKLELQKEVFTSCRQHIVKYLSPDDVVDTLISKRLIGETASQHVTLPIKTPQDKNRIIVDELASGGPDAYEKFRDILKKSSRTRHIADHLEKGVYVTYCAVFMYTSFTTPLCIH